MMFKDLCTKFLYLDVTLKITLWCPSTTAFGALSVVAKIVQIMQFVLQAGCAMMSLSLNI